MKNIAFILGTRPEIIKMAPLIKEAYKRGLSPTVINTGQHKELLYSMWDFFGIKAHYDLAIMQEGQDLSHTCAKAISSISEVLYHHKPDYVVVQGDTTTTFAGAMAGYYNGIKVAHIEAGLRTYDLSSPFPEEAHRQMVSKIADLHFCATESNKHALIFENVSTDKIFVVGNPGLDSLRETVLDKLEDDPKKKKHKQILLTLHRRESFGEPMEKILQAVNYLVEYGGIRVTFPVHPNPNVREAVSKHLKKCPEIEIVNPLDYFSFVKAMWDADVILSDSGGVQEEAPFLGKPTVVLREKTERIETLGKSSFLVGADLSKIINITISILSKEETFKRDFSYGDGYSAPRILDVLTK